MNTDQVDVLMNSIDRMEDSLEDLEEYLKKVEKVSYEAREALDAIELVLAERYERIKYYDAELTPRAQLEFISLLISELKAVNKHLEKGIA